VAVEVAVDDGILRRGGEGGGGLLVRGRGRRFLPGLRSFPVCLFGSRDSVGSMRSEAMPDRVGGLGGLRRRRMEEAVATTTTMAICAGRGPVSGETTDAAGKFLLQSGLKSFRVFARGPD